MKTKLSTDEAAQKVAKMARSGQLPYNIDQNVQIKRTQSGKIFVEACSEKGWNNNTRIKFEIYEDPNDGDTRIITHEHDRNTAELYKISEVDDELKEKWRSF